MDMGTRFGLALVALWVSLVIAAIYGWVANIVKFVGMLDGEVTTMFIARIVGMPFAPLGAVLGYF